MWYRLRFHLENFLLRGTLYQVTFLACILAFLAVVAAVTVFVFDRPAHKDFWGALWWAFLRLTDTGYLGDDHGWLDRTVSTVLTFSGDVVFLGALVAILTTGLDRAMRTLSSGRGRVLAEGHLVIMASAGEISVVAEELLSAERRIRPDQGKSTLVLLLPEVNQSIVSEVLRSIPSPLARSARILCRQGDVFDEESLQRVSWKKASCLLILAPPEGPPAAVFKLLLSLSRQRGSEPLPRLVTTSWQTSDRERLHRLNWPSDFDVIPEPDFAGQILAQTLDSPGLSELYRQILTDQEGDSLYLLRPAPPEYHGKSLQEAVMNSETCTPIGILRDLNSQHSLVSMAQLEETIEPGDGVVILASSPRVSLLKPAAPREAPAEWMQQHSPGRLVICGTCPWWKPLLLDLCLRGGSDLSILCLAEGFPTTRGLPEQVSLRVVENLEQELLVFDFSGFGQVLHLAGPFPDNAKVADIETITNIHALLENPRFVAARPRLLCELYLEKNRTLVQCLDPSIEVVTTARFLQHVVAQVGAKPALYEIYEDLLAVGGCCFQSLLLTGPEAVCWRDLKCWALQRSLLPLGLFLSREQSHWPAGVHIHPQGDRPLQLSGNEYILALRREAHAPGPSGFGPA